MTFGKLQDRRPAISVLQTCMHGYDRAVEKKYVHLHKNDNIMPILSGLVSERKTCRHSIILLLFERASC